MSVELRNKTKSLGQFASNNGYSELIAASEGVDVLDSFFEDGFTESAEEVADALVALKGTKDVKSTASGLADMLRGQELVFITNGTFDGDGDEEEDHPHAGTESNKPEDISKSVYARVEKAKKKISSP